MAQFAFAGGVAEAMDNGTCELARVNGNLPVAAVCNRHAYHPWMKTGLGKRMVFQQLLAFQGGNFANFALFADFS